MKFPGSVLISLVLFVAETATALCLSGAYRAAGDRMWQWLTLLFALLPCALVQLSLVFIHRDVSRDRPLVLLLHLLQLGPLVRSVSAPRPRLPGDADVCVCIFLISALNVLRQRGAVLLIFSKQQWEK